jgi:hypothetical protein
MTKAPEIGDSVRHPNGNDIGFIVSFAADGEQVDSVEDADYIIVKWAENRFEPIAISDLEFRSIN